jgi:hypothetical protein
MAALVTIEAVAICLLGLLVAGLLRSHAEILRQLHDLGAGGHEAPLPNPRVRRDLPADTVDGADIAGSTPAGEAVVVGVVGSKTPTLLAFLSSSCVTCVGFWDAFATADGRRLPGGGRVVVVTRDADEESPAAIAKRTPAGVTVVLSSAAWEAYRVPASPYFVLVAESGRIKGEGTASTWDEMRSLVASARADEAELDGERRADQELLAAGIVPGDPRLYPDTAAAPHPPS